MNQSNKESQRFQARTLTSEPVLYLILLSGFIIRILIVISTHQIPLQGDELDYLKLGQHFAHSHQIFDYFRPPVYPLFIGILYGIFNKLVAVRIVQVVISIVSILIFSTISRRLYGEVNAAAIALWMTFDPVHTAFSYSILSETVFVFFLLLALRLSPLLQDTRGIMHFFSGICWALSALTRSFGVILFFVFLISCFQRGKGFHQFKAALLMMAGLLIPLAGWSVFATTQSGSFILIDNNGLYNVLVGTHPDSAFKPKDDHWEPVWGTIAGKSYRKSYRQDPENTHRVAAREILTRLRQNPKDQIHRRFWEIAHLWTLDNHLLIQLRHLHLGSRALFWLAPAAIFSACISVWIYITGLLGLIFIPDRYAFKRFTIAAMISATIFFGLVFSTSRYMMPIRMFMAVFAIETTRSIFRHRPFKFTRTKCIIAAVGVILLPFSWARDIPLFKDLIFDQGRESRQPDMIPESSIRSDRNSSGEPVPPED